MLDQTFRITRRTLEHDSRLIVPRSNNIYYIALCGTTTGIAVSLVPRPRVHFAPVSRTYDSALDLLRYLLIMLTLLQQVFHD